LSSAYFPPFYRFVNCFGPSFSPDFPLLALFEANQPRENLKAIRHYPRLYHQQVVLMRETWCIPEESIPSAGKSEGHFSYFRRLRRWAMDLGIARRVFVTAMQTSDYFRSNLPSNKFRRVHKPFFVDWDNFATHQLFRRFTRVRGATVTISEMLPLPEQIPSNSEAEARSTELIFELYDLPGAFH
jgi:hypothetical protein